MMILLVLSHCFKNPATRGLYRSALQNRLGLPALGGPAADAFQQPEDPQAKLLIAPMLVQQQRDQILPCQPFKVDRFAVAPLLPNFSGHRRHV
jgi:hypothetical protein